MTGRIPLWIDLRHVPVNKRLPFLHVLEEAGCERVLLQSGDPHVQRKGLDVVTVDNNDRLRHKGRSLGRLVHLKEASDQASAARGTALVLVDAADWRIIPLENLIAARRDRPGTLYALARSSEDALLFAQTLQTGVHGLVLAPPDSKTIRVVHDALQSLAAEARPATKVAPAASVNDDAAANDGEFLQAATVTSVQDGGPGDRVCVDTTSIFRPGEGLLVGSTARSFCLVHAETLATDYIQARPFRVNAGAVHMYLYAPDATTRYLSELAAGTAVLAVHPDGIHRALHVGRAKIERRPHTLVQWKDAHGRPASAMLQTAETIRLVRPDGTPLAVTDVKVGDQILVHHESAARHTGLPIDADLEER